MVNRLRHGAGLRNADSVQQIFKNRVPTHKVNDHRFYYKCRLFSGGGVRKKIRLVCENCMKQRRSVGINLKQVVHKVTAVHERFASKCLV